jgi:F-type H+-transporting ATPase subunit c
MMNPMVAKVLAVSLIAFPIGLVGIAVGRIFITTIEAISRNPDAEGKLSRQAMLGFAVTEAIALILFVLAILILFQ